jgi:uncharacterized membrane protein YsdA (DUF1294 family)
MTNIYVVMCFLPAKHVYQIDKLNNANYNTWSIKEQMLLMRNEIWGMVYGFELDPRVSNI